MRAPGSAKKRSCCATTAGAVAQHAFMSRLLRRDPEQTAGRPLAAVLDQIQRTVRRLLDAANTRTHVVAPDLGAGLAIDLDTKQRLRRQARDERVTLPIRESVTVVEDHAARRDRRYPRDRGRLELGPRLVIRNRATAVVDALRDERPAVVLASDDAVDL